MAWKQFYTYNPYQPQQPASPNTQLMQNYLSYGYGPENQFFDWTSLYGKQKGVGQDEQVPQQQTAGLADLRAMNADRGYKPLSAADYYHPKYRSYYDKAGRDLQGK